MSGVVHTFPRHKTPAAVINETAERAKMREFTRYLAREAARRDYDAANQSQTRP